VKGHHAEVEFIFHQYPVKIKGRAQAAIFVETKGKLIAIPGDGLGQGAVDNTGRTAQSKKNAVGPAVNGDPGNVIAVEGNGRQVGIAGVVGGGQPANA